MILKREKLIENVQKVVVIQNKGWLIFMTLYTQKDLI